MRNIAVQEMFRDYNLKLAHITKEGIKNIVLICDYDNTLTCKNFSFKLVYNSKKMPFDFKYITQDLLTKYKLEQINLKLSNKEKTKKLQSHTFTLMQEMIKSGFNKSILEESLKNNPAIYRKNVEKVLGFAKINNIPTYVFSSGFGNVIEESLKSTFLDHLPKNLKIYSNFIEFDKSDKPILNSISLEKTITSANKQANKWFSEEDKVNITDKNIIYIANKPQDYKMIQGLDCRNALGIAIVNGSKLNNDKFYSQNFETILFSNHFDQIKTILDLIN